MSTTWTTKARAVALKNLNWDLNLDYQISPWDSVNVVEGALHEIAHAVVLGIDQDKDFADILPHLAETVTDRLKDYPKRFKHGRMLAGAWQEALTLAAEVLVLKHLRLQVWQIVVLGAARRESPKKHPHLAWTFRQHVRRATTWASTRRRAARVLQVLDYCCELGLRT